MIVVVKVLPLFGRLQRNSFSVTSKSFPASWR